MCKKDLVKVISSGIGATFLMDLFNKLGALLGWVYRMDLTFLGCVFNGWINGVYTYKSPAELLESGGTKAQGMFGHYLIGIIFSFFLYFLLRRFRLNENEIYTTAIILGLSATIFSLILIFPTTGFGLFGWKVGMGLLGSSIFNHVGFGFGLAIFYRLFDLNYKNAI
ncbi:MAG: DUF2938 family protein [Cellvibrionales bacterium]|nr:DUF2938 family protein [Cellvibrionales bacterium]